MIHSSQRRLRAFTLIELMAATSVLVIIVLMITQLISETSKVIKQDSNRMDSFSIARTLFDRMSIDWKSRVIGTEPGFFGIKELGDDSILMYSRGPAYSGTRSSATAVGYRISDHIEGGRSLQRAALGYNWSETDPRPDDNPLLLDAGTMPVLDNADYQDVGLGVLRFEIAFLVYEPGATPPGTSTVSWKSVQPSAEELKPDKETGKVAKVLRGIGLYFVTMDKDSVKLLQGNLAPVRNVDQVFLDAADGIDTAQIWRNILNDSGKLAQDLGVPVLFTQGLQVYQRYLPLETKGL